MARTQIVATSGNRRLAPDQVAAMNARRAGLYRDLAQQESNRQRAQDLQFRNKEFRQNERIARDRQALEEKSQRMSAGISAVNLGMGINNLTQSNPAGFAAKSLGTLAPGIFGGGGGVGRAMGDFTLGSGLSSGLAGFGASMFAGKDASKLKKGLYGAGAGLAMGLLGGGGGFGSAIGGASFGALGSLFG
jgi:hypothetical protein